MTPHVTRRPREQLSCCYDLMSDCYSVLFCRRRMTLQVVLLVAEEE